VPGPRRRSTSASRPCGSCCGTRRLKSSDGYRPGKTGTGPEKQ
jgi:hypothetical protein